MILRFRHLLIAAVLGGLVAAALPVAAAQVGDPLRLGETNVINQATALRGSAPANLVIRNTGDGVPLSLKNNTGGVPNGKPPLAVDSRRLVKNLNVDRVDFFNANELVRAAGDTTSNVTDANGDALSVSFTAPRDGILLMSASLDVSADVGQPDWFYCQLKLDDVILAHSRRNVVVHAPGAPHTANYEENCSTDGVVGVASGFHRVDFNIASWNTAALGGGALWVIWVPFGPHGNLLDATTVIGDDAVAEPKLVVEP